MMRVGFEPTPFRTRLVSRNPTSRKELTLVWRLRPLGHLTV